MYYTYFTYEGSPKHDHQIIHRKPAEPYAEDLATYPEFFTVTRKPTKAEAEVFFSVCKPGNLCAGIKSATTEELTESINTLSPEKMFLGEWEENSNQ